MRDRTRSHEITRAHLPFTRARVRRAALNQVPAPTPNQVGLVLLMVDAATDSLDLVAQLFIAYLSQAGSK